MGFRNESCVEIGRENVVLGMLTPGGHVALEDVHHTVSNFEFAFLSSVLASSSLRVMTNGVVAYFATPVTKLQLSRNLPTFISFVTNLKEVEIITELLSGNKQGGRIHVTVSALDVLTDR